MAKLRFFLFCFVLICVVLLALAFLYRNALPTQIDLIVFDVMHVSVGVLALASFVIGGVLGLVVRVPSAIWQRSQSKMQGRVLARKEREIERLKNEVAKAG
ncbi:MAG: hypothetical protein C9356_13475 [Oleiphilus sp.]|nr:MAG: hypothetical protein C9356_13475 [Oleiphilus sp.]